MTTASAPRGIIPPVAMTDRFTGSNDRCRDDAGVNDFVGKAHAARDFL